MSRLELVFLVWGYIFIMFLCFGNQNLLVTDALWHLSHLWGSFALIGKVYNGHKWSANKGSLHWFLKDGGATTSVPAQEKILRWNSCQSDQDHISYRFNEQRPVDTACADVVWPEKEGMWKYTFYLTFYIWMCVTKPCLFSMGNFWNEQVEPS